MVFLKKIYKYTKTGYQMLIANNNRKINGSIYYILIPFDSFVHQRSHNWQNFFSISIKIHKLIHIGF